MGLPINKLIVATNNNDILKRVINTGVYKPLKVVHTISPSMDIQIASNFERLIFDISSLDSKKTSKLMNDLKNHGEFKLEVEDINKIKQNFYSESLSDDETKLVIQEVFEKKKLLIDPHTAVAVGVANKISLKEKVIVLATAHPAKFYEIVESQTKVKAELPDSLKPILTKKEVFKKIPQDVEEIKSYILENS